MARVVKRDLCSDGSGSLYGVWDIQNGGAGSLLADPHKSSIESKRLRSKTGGDP